MESKGLTENSSRSPEDVILKMFRDGVLYLHGLRMLQALSTYEILSQIPLNPN